MTDRHGRIDRPEARTPDEIEQLQVVSPTAAPEEFEPEEFDRPDRPLTPDEIEQRQVVEYDPDDAPAGGS